jgi:hypothetical protein
MRLQPQGKPAGATRLGDHARAIVQLVEIRTDQRRVEQRQAVIADQHRHLAKRILATHGGVRADRASFVMNHLDAGGKAGLMRHHQHLAREVRVRLVKKLHVPARLLLRSSPRRSLAGLEPARRQLRVR